MGLGGAYPGRDSRGDVCETQRRPLHSRGPEGLRRKCHSIAGGLGVADARLPAAITSWPAPAPAHEGDLMLSDAPSKPASDALGGRGSPPAGGPARLLADVHADGTWTTLAEHRSRYSPPPAPKREPDDRIIDLVDEAGLRGRGGAGFPTGRKLRTVSQGRAPRIVIGNGTEGEPASAKDRLLMSRLPHLVIDGALLAAAAVGADRIGIGVERNNTE